LTGVFRFGFTFPKAVGSTPERPIPYQVRVPPLKQAIDTAIAEFTRAKSRKTQAPGQTSCASVATGHAAAVGMVPTLARRCRSGIWFRDAFCADDVALAPIIAGKSLGRGTPATGRSEHAWHGDCWADMPTS
jgi:hypothetical protein